MPSTQEISLFGLLAKLFKEYSAMGWAIRFNPNLIRDSPPDRSGKQGCKRGTAVRPAAPCAQRRGTGGEWRAEGSQTNWESCAVLQLPLRGAEGHGSEHPSTSYSVFLSSNAIPIGLSGP